MKEDLMLTTFDNPFNPFTDFITWWKVDMLLGHNTCSLLAEMSNTSDAASDEVNDEYIQEAMHEIVEMSPYIFRIVRESDYAC